VSDPQLKQTPLHSRHAAAGAKTADFGGWDMPIEYSGVVAEHTAVRTAVGVFDVSHMGKVRIHGPGAVAFLNDVLANDLDRITDGHAQYSMLCNEEGGVVDDLIVYRWSDDEVFMIPNAANAATVVADLRDRAPADVTVDDHHEDHGIIAVQGPRSRELLAAMGLPADHDYMAMASADFAGQPLIVCRTGYTGEHGYELYLPNADALPVWQELMDRGADLQVAPIGLAARDTLRFEVCYCLYGHELAEDITPLEAGIGWAVKLKKDAFTGREALLAQKAAGVPRRLVCLRIEGRGIARQGQVVKQDGRPVGFVTSGTFSPTLKQALAMALVSADTADGALAVDVRGKDLVCRTVPFPFLPARTKGDPRAERPLSS